MVAIEQDGKGVVIASFWPFRHTVGDARACAALADLADAPKALRESLPVIGRLSPELGRILETCLADSMYRKKLVDDLYKVADQLSVPFDADEPTVVRIAE